MKELELEIYPLTIICDRYNGSYSQAKYLAFPLDHWSIPEEIGGADPDEDGFWNYTDRHKEYIIGKGDTPQEALKDLNCLLNPNILI